MRILSLAPSNTEILFGDSLLNRPGPHLPIGAAAVQCILKHRSSVLL